MDNATRTSIWLPVSDFPLAHHEPVRVPDSVFGYLKGLGHAAGSLLVVAEHTTRFADIVRRVFTVQHPAGPIMHEEQINRIRFADFDQQHGNV
jgi:hypothetical protein